MTEFERVMTNNTNLKLVSPIRQSYMRNNRATYYRPEVKNKFVHYIRMTAGLFVLAVVSFAFLVYRYFKNLVRKFREIK